MDKIVSGFVDASLIAHGRARAAERFPTPSGTAAGISAVKLHFAEAQLAATMAVVYQLGIVEKALTKLAGTADSTWESEPF